VVPGGLFEQQKAEYGNHGDQAEDHQAVLIRGDLAKLGEHVFGILVPNMNANWDEKLKETSLEPQIISIHMGYKIKSYVFLNEGVPLKIANAAKKIRKM
jgi:hypothetical protein